MTAAVSSPTPCACGHSRAAHDHMHTRTYCSAVLDIGGYCACQQFRAATIEPLRRALAGLLAWWRRG